MAERRVLRTWVFVGVGASAELAQYAYDVLPSSAPGTGQ
jgi:hypothetical protein